MGKNKKCVKKIFIFAVLLIAVLGITSCAKEDDNPEMTQWEKKARLDAEETAEELYEAAKSEDVLKIYTISSRIFDVAESFQKQYPDIIVETTYYRAEEICERLHNAAAENRHECDLIFTTNGDGNLTDDLIPGRLVYKYLPYDMASSMREGGSDAYLSILLEVPMLTYNSSVFDEAPIGNIWELTLPEWKGRVYVTDPTKSNISYTFFSMLLQNSEKMEEAYEIRFQKKYEAVDGESAGEYFLRLLTDNGLCILNDSDDVAAAVAAPGSNGNAIGLLNASKLRLNSQGYMLQNISDLKPFAGVINPADIMVVGGTENINSAKLFIRWILGEKDGNGEGAAPFLQEGAWPSRSDVAGKDPRKLEDMDVIYTDESYGSANRDKFLELWLKLIE